MPRQVWTIIQAAVVGAVIFLIARPSVTSWARLSAVLAFYVTATIANGAGHSGPLSPKSFVGDDMDIFDVATKPFAHSVYVYHIAVQSILVIGVPLGRCWPFNAYHLPSRQMRGGTVTRRTGVTLIADTGSAIRALNVARQHLNTVRVGDFAALRVALPEERSQRRGRPSIIHKV